jgi:amidase
LLNTTASDLLRYPAVELLAAMHARELSPVDVVGSYLDRIDHVNPRINAVVTLRAEEALVEARQAEKAILDGRAKKLTGLPMTIKDTIDTAGIRTTAGSKLLAHSIPNFDAPAAARLRALGAIVLGKTNTAEFAMTYSTDNALFGRTRNPWNLDLTPGGSSGGEGAIIAAGGSPLGLGTDLGGSIRIPANFCGIVGLRPTVGRVSSGGHIPALSGPLGEASVIGPMAGCTEDIDLLMGVLVDDWKTQPSTRTASSSFGADQVAIAFYAEDGVVPVAPEVKAAVRTAVDELSQDHATIEEIVPPGLAELYRIWNELWEGSGGARGLIGDYAKDVGRLSPGLAMLVAASPERPDAARLRTAAARLRELRAEMLDFMERFSIIICPVAAGPPSERVGQWTIDGVDVRGSRGFGYSYGWSLLGLPALAVPTGAPHGVPAGIQIVARPNLDEQAIAVGNALQRRLSPIVAEGLR